MRAVRCRVCRSVWLSPDAEKLAGKPGCLRCDGMLDLLSEEETARALEEERAGGPSDPAD